LINDSDDDVAIIEENITVPKAKIIPGKNSAKKMKLDDGKAAETPAKIAPEIKPQPVEETKSNPVVP
jgi:hypothetical protein